MYKEYTARPDMWGFRALHPNIAVRLVSKLTLVRGRENITHFRHSLIVGVLDQQLSRSKTEQRAAQPNLHRPRGNHQHLAREGEVVECCVEGQARAVGRLTDECPGC